MSTEPTEADLERYAADLFAAPYERTEPFDRRTLVTDIEHANGGPIDESAPVPLVAVGRGRLGELDFDRAMWREVDQRMQIFAPASLRGQSYLLLGHAFADTPPEQATVKWCDTTQRIKTEGKKAKQLHNSHKKIMAIVDDKKRQQRLAQYAAKVRRDAQSMALYASCSRARMTEIDFCGRALRASLLQGRNKQKSHEEIILACCGCLTRMLSSQARPIGEQVVCEQCYLSLRQTGGTVTQRAIRGESTKSVSTNRVTTRTALDNTAGDNDSEEHRERLEHIRRAQQQLSPSYGALTADMVPLGMPCIMDRCKTFKRRENKMYGIEVLQDTDVGNETFGYVYMCANHARVYSSAFKVAYRMPLSTVQKYMVTMQKDFTQVVTHGSFLDDVMRRGAELNATGAQTRVETDANAKHKLELNRQRAARNKAIAESRRQQRAATSGLVAQ
jgi:hypothetical protein